MEEKIIKDLIKGGINEGYIAGGNILILKDRQEVFYHEDGCASLEKNIKIKRDSIFRIYSMTKPITATALMILFEKGKIDLYDPVSKYINSFKEQIVEVDGRNSLPYKEITIKDLLSMTSGLVYDGNNRAGRETSEVFKELDSRLFTDEPMSTEEFAEKIGNVPLAFQPGTSWQYGVSADILGAIIQKISGKEFRDFLIDEIFTPLNMKDTDFFVPKEKQHRLVNVYEKKEEGKLHRYKGNNLGIINVMDRKPAFQSGGAGLTSTIDDYARFASMLIGEGKLEGARILYPKTVDYLTNSTLNLKQQNSFDAWEGLSGYSYGNLMRIMVDESKSAQLSTSREYGWDGWLGTYFCNCPKEKLTILFMIQKTDAGTTTLTRKLKNVILSSFC